ncbi:966_t:CDS:2, partial [Cetraspora pellucida]
MSSKNQTVPVYHGAEVDDIENFLFDFEGHKNVGSEPNTNQENLARPEE